MKFGIIFQHKKNIKEKNWGTLKLSTLTTRAFQPLPLTHRNTLRCLKIKELIKKHKGIKKGSSELGFENFSQRIKSLGKFDIFQKPSVDLKEASRLTVKVGEMKKETVIKNKFSQINSERFYFLDGILSLSF